MTDDEYLRIKLSGFIKRVPDGVNRGSYQTAVAYKTWLGQATKAINNTRTGKQVMSSLINKYEQFK